MSKKKTGSAVFSTAQPAAANFAAENRRKKRKPQDHLEYDVMRAEALGYGCHYGAYKADHPETKAEYEAVTGAVEVKKVDTSKVEKTCPHCGTVFYATGLGTKKVYCCYECKQQANAERERARAAKVVNATCLWCGGQIANPTTRSRYCCPQCYNAAKQSRARQRWREKKGAENGV